MAIAMHCNLRPPDVEPVVLGFNYEADNASAYKFNDSATSTGLLCIIVPNFNETGHCTAELLMI